MGKTEHLSKDGADKTQHKLKLTGHVQWQTNESVTLEIQTIEKERKNNQEIGKGPGEMSQRLGDTLLLWRTWLQFPAPMSSDSRELQFLWSM